jgi:hypothetical protein
MKKILPILLVELLLMHGLAVGDTIGENVMKASIDQEYVIITTNELADSVDTLKLWKEFLGYSVEVKTIEQISSSFQGVDLQEKIRNCLIESYHPNTTLYVLIVGSRGIIPMRICHPIPQEFDDVYLETDYYYADLNGNWNADNDIYFGEYANDDVNFIPEAYVGRIPSDSKDTIKKICKNIIKFESKSGDWKSKTLLLGSILYYQGLEAFDWVYARSDGATLMEECRCDIFEPNGLSCVTMYETEGMRPSTYECDFPLTRENVLAEWTKGYAIVNMLGHSDERHVTRFIWRLDDGDNIPEFAEGELAYVDVLKSSDSGDLALEIPPIVFSDGCSQLYSTRNMGKAFMENGAAVAFIGTTDLGLYNITRVWNDERDGGCFSLDYYFFDNLIAHNQNCGDALFNSKVYFSNHFMFTEYNPDWIYRCFSTLYGFTLYGDPSMTLTNNKTDHNPPTVRIEKPRGHLYLFDKELLPLSSDRPIILGDISVTFSASDDETGIEKSDIFVDNQLKNTIEEKQYTWLWNETAVGTHTLHIKSYDNAGNEAVDEVNVWIMNFV